MINLNILMLHFQLTLFPLYEYESRCSGVAGMSWGGEHDE